MIFSKYIYCIIKQPTKLILFNGMATRLIVKIPTKLLHQAPLNYLRR